jgi:hypothetical protein
MQLLKVRGPSLISDTIERIQVLTYNYSITCIMPEDQANSGEFISECLTRSSETE